MPEAPAESGIEVERGPGPARRVLEANAAHLRAVRAALRADDCGQLSTGALPRPRTRVAPAGDARAAVEAAIAGAGCDVESCDGGEVTVFADDLGAFCDAMATLDVRGARNGVDDPDFTGYGCVEVDVEVDGGSVLVRAHDRGLFAAGERAERRIARDFFAPFIRGPTAAARLALVLGLPEGGCCAAYLVGVGGDDARELLELVGDAQGAAAIAERTARARFSCRAEIGRSTADNFHDLAAREDLAARDAASGDDRARSSFSGRRGLRARAWADDEDSAMVSTTDDDERATPQPPAGGPAGGSRRWDSSSADESVDDAAAAGLRYGVDTHFSRPRDARVHARAGASASAAGDAAAAAAAYRQSLVVREAVLRDRGSNQDIVDAAAACSDLAASLLRVVDLAVADEPVNLLRRSLTLYEGALGKSSHLAARAKLQLADALAVSGSKAAAADEADALRRSAAETLDNELGPDHSLTRYANWRPI